MAFLRFDSFIFLLGFQSGRYESSAVGCGGWVWLLGLPKNRRVGTGQNVMVLADTGSRMESALLLFVLEARSDSG
jgi:hypothetical protein